MSASFNRTQFGHYVPSNVVPLQIRRQGSEWLVETTERASDRRKTSRVQAFRTLGDAKVFATPLANHPQGVAACEEWVRLAARKLEGFGGHARAARFNERMRSYLAAWSDPAMSLYSHEESADGYGYFKPSEHRRDDEQTGEVWEAASTIAALVPGETVTADEGAQVLSWVEDWARDTFEDFEAEDFTPRATLHTAHRHLEGGLATVLADVRRVGKVNPRVHTFETTSEAYNRSQVDDSIRDGDVLTVPSEGAVAVMVSAWPTAITDNASGEAFHKLGTGIDWGAVPNLRGGMDDYRPSAELARAELGKLRAQAAHDDLSYDVNEPRVK